MPKGNQFLRILFLICAVFVLAVPQANGQGKSTITGKIVDSTAAVIPGAEVTITSLATGEARSVVTGDAGSYRMTNLIPGDYEVKAVMTGFKTGVARVTVTTNEVAHVDLTLEVGEVTETVTVSDAATIVNTEQGRVSSLVDQRRITDLPLNGRNVYELVLLTPGAVNSTATIFEPGGSPNSNTGANVNGGRANMNGFSLDGISTTGLSGGSNIQPNIDAVQEFRIETLNFSAEYGGNVGSVVEVVSKSGGNAFHGSLFEFHRNDNLDAREFFDRCPEGETECKGGGKPGFIQNQFGGSFGGPIIKDSTFFFGSYEGTRIRTGESTVTNFESAQWANFVKAHGAPVAQFLYKNFPGRPLDTLDPDIGTVGQYLQSFGYIPSEDDNGNPISPTQADVDTALAGLFGSPAGALGVNDPMVGQTSFFTPQPTDTDQFSVRIDQEFGSDAKIYGRYFFSDTDGPIVEARPAFNSPQKVRTHQLAFNWTQIISPSIVNEARAGLNRGINDILAGTPGVPLIAESGSGTDAFGAYNGYPQIFHENFFVYADTLSINRGSHGMKMGIEAHRKQENSEFNVGRPSMYFFDLVYLALDDPYYQIGGVDPNFGGPGKAELASNFRGWRASEIGVFFNDDWKFKPNLTLNLGVRWDWFGRLNEVQNRATAFDFKGGSNLFERVVGGEFIGPVGSLADSDFNNFAPRIGFAWDPFSDGKMSVRGGYGIAYNGGIFNPLANSRWNKPFYSFNLICKEDICGRPGEVVLFGPQDGSPVRADGPNNNPGASQFEGNIIAYFPGNPNVAFLSGIVEQKIRDPYVQSFFFGIQREVMANTTLEVNYVGTLGRKLIRAENPNRFVGDRIGFPNPVTGEREGDTAFNRLNENEGVLRVWQNAVASNYHSLQVQLNRRYSNGFALNANYTWAKSLDTRSTWHSGATSANLGQEGFSSDVTNVALDYGRSIFDARHRFVVNFLWDTPWFRTADQWFLRHVVGGWQFNAVANYQSGQPFTPFLSNSFPAGGDFNADGNNNDRPNTPSFGNTFSDAGRNDFADRAGGVFNIAGGTQAKLALFGRPANGTNGNLGRNTFDGPDLGNVDFSIFKEIGLSMLSEDAQVQVRFEIFNLLNRPNFLQPEPRINNPQFGQSTALFDAREIQIGVKILF